MVQLITIMAILQASHVRTGSAVEVWAYRYHSKTDRFLSVTTSTPVPMVLKFNYIAEI